MEGAEERPPADLWARIDHQLQAQQDTAYYRERLSWYRRAAAACLVLLVGLGVFTYSIYRPGPEIVLRQTPDSELLAPDASSDQAVDTQPSAGLASTDRSNNRDRQSSSRAENLQENQDRVVGDSPERQNQKGGGSESTALAVPTVEEERIMPETILAREEKRGANIAEDDALGIAGDENPVQAGAGEQPSRVRPEVLALQKEKQPEASQPYSQAQIPEVLPSAPKRSRWSVSSSYGPQYFAQNISLRNNFYGSSRGMVNNSPALAYFNGGPSTYDQAINEFIQNTRPAQSYGATVKAGYQLDRFWRVDAGFTFTQNEAQTRTSFLVTGMNIMTSRQTAMQADVAESFKSVAALPTATIMLPALAGLDNRSVSVNKTDDFITRYRYRYVGIPLQLGFQTRQTRSFVFASAGLTPQVLVQSSIIPESSLASRIDYSLGDESPFREWNVSASASAGYGYRLTDGFSVSVGPELQYFFAPLIKSSGISHIEQGNPYNVGLRLSVRYSLERKD